MPICQMKSDLLESSHLSKEEMCMKLAYSTMLVGVFFVGLHHSQLCQSMHSPSFFISLCHTRPCQLMRSSSFFVSLHHFSLC